jgi:type VI secretion system secreted protein Hcp
MAITAYLTLKGQKRREDTILVHSFSHEILSPRDPASGLPTGKRQHQPVLILKEIDRSSPPLWSALVSNENLVTFQLAFYAPVAATGAEKLTSTITLTNASISSIAESMPDNELAANAGLPLREQVTFTYQKIQWTWADGGITAMDDWVSPVT